MDLRILSKLLGGLVTIISLFLLLPGVYGVLSEESAGGTLIAIGVIGSLIGAIIFLTQRKIRSEINHRTGLAIVGLSWIVSGGIGALPYALTGSTPTILDALFESVSGFSGTGASILTDIEGTQSCILLWRSMTQWIGGMGIILFFIAILPILGVGGVQLFRAETPGPNKDKITPRVRETARRLWGLYLGLTVLLVVLLFASGMSFFDAVNHAMTTLSTGGFSTKGDGIAAFNSPQIEYLLIIFMLISSVNFSLYYRLFATRKISELSTTESRWYLSLLTIFTAIITYTLWTQSEGLALNDAVRQSLFTVVCTASSTGFTNVDYMTWPVGIHTMIVLLMFMGGMSGSTAGGLKCIRIVAAMKQLMKEVKKVIHPRGLYAIKVNDHAVPDDIVNTIWGFIFLYFTVFTALICILTFQGLDLLSSATAAISALSNIGPALGELGPYDNYSQLPDLSKAALLSGMLLGRLEFYTLIVLFTREYWRK
ncbi:TrkH family potassium uptake protein [bacterium]|nr:TrkH family potassium uptake protein [bacterium]